MEFRFEGKSGNKTFDEPSFVKAHMAPANMTHVANIPWHVAVLTGLRQARMDAGTSFSSKFCATTWIAFVIRASISFIGMASALCCFDIVKSWCVRVSTNLA